MPRPRVGAGGDSDRRRRRDRADRLARLRCASGLASIESRGRGPRDGVKTLPLQPRRGAAAVRRDRAAGVGRVGVARRGASIDLEHCQSELQARA